MEVWDFIYNLFPRLSELIRQGLGAVLPEWAVYVIMALIGIIILLGFVMTTVMGMIYAERRIIARIQVRQGPNRVGPFGLLQPIADALKMFGKEDISSDFVDKPIFRLAPILFVFPAIMVYAVIPFSQGTILTDLGIGILFIVAISSLAMPAIMVAGWSSNNKFSLLGGLRAVSQLVSYEIPMVLAIVGVVLIAGSLSMERIVEAQTVPFILLQPIGFFVFFVSSLGELNRPPFDMLEADSEIVAGYHTEYGGMSFGLFLVAEYINLLAFSGIITTLFLGGWKGPILPPYVWFVVKVAFVILLLFWVRSTVPRLRVDQFMGFAWKFLLPLALLNVFLTALGVLLWDSFVA